MYCAAFRRSGDHPNLALLRLGQMQEEESFGKLPGTASQPASTEVEGTRLHFPGMGAGQRRGSCTDPEASLELTVRQKAEAKECHLCLRLPRHGGHGVTSHTEQFLSLLFLCR